jgi:hypothetical protein
VPREQVRLNGIKKAMKEVVKAGKGVTVIGKESAHVKRQAKRGQGGLQKVKVVA